MATTEEIGRRAVARMVKVGNGQAPVDEMPDPLRAAMDMQDQRQAASIRHAAAQQAELEMQLQNAELQNRVRKLRVEEMRMERDERKLAEEEAAKQPAGGVESPLLAEVLAALLQDRADTSQRLYDVLTNRKAEEAREDAQQPGGQAPVSVLQERLIELRELMTTVDQLRPARAESPQQQVAPRFNDVDSMIRLREADLNFELKRAELAAQERRAEEEHQRRMRQLEGSEMAAQQEAASRNERNQRLGDLVEKLGPQALAAFRDNMVGRGASAEPPPRPHVLRNPEQADANGHAPPAAPPVPIDCPQCGTHFEADPGLPQVNCPNCGQVFKAKEVPDAPRNPLGWPEPEAP